MKPAPPPGRAAFRPLSSNSSDPMKHTRRLLSVLAALALGFVATAADSPGSGHAHDSAKKIATPHGGRLLAKPTPPAEFFVLPDRKVRITFLDAAGRPVAPAAQVVTVTAGDRAAPTKLAFTRVGDALVSDGALPAGDKFPAVVQIKATPDAKAVVERFNLDFAVCPGCKLAEYACSCAH